MPNLINPYRFGTAAVGGTGFIAAYSSSANAASYSFPVDIGTAAASRVVAVACAIYDGTTNNGFTSLTIGGSAATKATTTDTTAGSNLGTARVVGIYYLPVAAGTTSTIVVTPANAAESCGIVVFALYPASSTPVYSASDSTPGAATLNLASIDCTTGGLLIAINQHNNSTQSTWVWSIGGDTVTEHIDEALGDSGIRWGVVSVPTNTTSLVGSLTAGWALSNNAGMSVATWGP